MEHDDAVDRDDHGPEFEARVHVRAVECKGGGPGVDGYRRRLVERLRHLDEEAFRDLVRRYDSALRRMARMYVADSVADEVVQDTRVIVIRGLDRFEGRSSLKTWLSGILINVARRRAARGGRTVPFSATGSGSDPWVGYHGGFLGGEFGYAGQPEAFAHRLREVLDRN